MEENEVYRRKIQFYKEKDFEKEQNRNFGNEVPNK